MSVRTDLDVTRLDIAMHDPLPVEIRYGRDNGFEDRQCLSQGQRSFLLNAFVEGLAIDVLHHDTGATFDFVIFKEPGDAGVMELCLNVGFVPKTLDEVRLAIHVGENLHRRDMTVLNVNSPIHHAHPAGTK